MATKTFEELKQLAIQIRDEKTNKQNTATRVGRHGNAGTHKQARAGLLRQNQNR